MKNRLLRDNERSVEDERSQKMPVKTQKTVKTREIKMHIRYNIRVLVILYLKGSQEIRK
jgi:hypothetical protein